MTKGDSLPGAPCPFLPMARKTDPSFLPVGDSAFEDDRTSRPLRWSFFPPSSPQGRHRLVPLRERVPGSGVPPSRRTAPFFQTALAVFRAAIPRCGSISHRRAAQPPRGPPSSCRVTAPRQGRGPPPPTSLTSFFFLPRTRRPEVSERASKSSLPDGKHSYLRRRGLIQ